MNDVPEMDAYMCGEPKPLRDLSPGKIGDVIDQACGTGQVAVLTALSDERPDEFMAHLEGVYSDEGAWSPIYSAALGGHFQAIKYLLCKGCDANSTKPSTGQRWRGGFGGGG